MTKIYATHLMPAGITDPINPTTGKDRREVNAMALFNIRRGVRKRASIQRSEIDKTQLLALARARCRYQEDMAAQLAARYVLRTNR